MKRFFHLVAHSPGDFFISPDEIESLVNQSKEPDGRRLSLMLKEAEKCKGLSLEDAAALFSVKNPFLLEKLYDAADMVKKKVFGARVVLFAPLYLSNHCVNSCLYCGFRSPNKDLPRIALTEKELISEAEALEKMGFKRILLVTGEDERFGIDYIAASVRAIYKKTGIRIVHVNAPPMDTPELKELKSAGVAVYQAFQETYHRPTYESMHPSGKKKDYDYRISVMDRAFAAGFKDVGIGALLGLYDYRFDCLSTIAHSKHLFENYGTHAHTLSVPRLTPASGSALDDEAVKRRRVSDEELKKIVAVYRLCAPSAGVVISTREPARLRSSLIRAGASQMSAASSTEPGGYAGKKRTLKQFSTLDGRSLLSVIVSVIKEGGMPSLCTTCYRTGRVGENFTKITNAGEMEKFCQANALLTLKEYLLDHPPNGLKDIFRDAMEKGFGEIKGQEIKKIVLEKLKELEKGKRDVYL